MWVVLFVIAEVVAIIWLAGFLLVILDRWRGPGAETPVKAQPVDAPDMTADLPRWKHLLGVILGAILFPPLVVLLFVLAAPLVAVNVGFLAYHWLRLKLFGIPMPSLGLPDEAFESPEVS
jgi:hypothetical protein